MKSFSIALLVAALGSASAFAQDCVVPDAPTLPDGATASMEQMLAGQQAVKGYQTANSEYRSCLDPQLSAAVVKATAEEASDADKAAAKALEDAYNQSVSREEAVAGQFNTEIRAYKAANPE